MAFVAPLFHTHISVRQSISYSAYAHHQLRSRMLTNKEKMVENLVSSFVHFFQGYLMKSHNWVA